MTYLDPTESSKARVGGETDLGIYGTVNWSRSLRTKRQVESKARAQVPVGDERDHHKPDGIKTRVGRILGNNDIVVHKLGRLGRVCAVAAIRRGVLFALYELRLHAYNKKVMGTVKFVKAFEGIKRANVFRKLSNNVRQLKAWDRDQQRWFFWVDILCIRTKIRLRKEIIQLRLKVLEAQEATMSEDFTPDISLNNIDMTVHHESITGTNCVLSSSSDSELFVSLSATIEEMSEYSAICSDLESIESDWLQYANCTISPDLNSFEGEIETSDEPYIEIFEHLPSVQDRLASGFLRIPMLTRNFIAARLDEQDAPFSLSASISSSDDSSETII